MNLADWINTPLLTPSHLDALAASLRSNDMSTVVIDNFLRPERWAGLQAVFEDDSAFEEKFQVRLPDGQFKETSKEDWLAAGEDAQVERQLLLDSTPSVSRLTHGIAQHMRFMGLARHRVFADFLGRIGGISGLAFENGEARIMRAPHIVKPPFGWQTRVVRRVVPAHAMDPGAPGTARAVSGERCAACRADPEPAGDLPARQRPASRRRTHRRGQRLAAMQLQSVV